MADGQPGAIGRRVAHHVDWDINQEEERASILLHNTAEIPVQGMVPRPILVLTEIAQVLLILLNET